MKLTTLKLNDFQLDRLSEFTANLGLVFFASAIAPLFSETTEGSSFVLGLGLTFTAGCLVASLLLLKGGVKV